MTALIACPHCRSHCRVDEIACPHCEGRLRSRDGRIERTAAAVVLGLTVAGIGAGTAGCAPKYGGPPAPPPDRTSEVAPVTAEPSATTSATATPSVGASAPAPPADVYGVAPVPERSE